MASTVSLSLLCGGTLQTRCARNVHVSPRAAHPSKPESPSVSLSGASRRNLLFSMTAATVMTGLQSSSMAEDIPFLGIRKKLKKAEEEAMEIMKEGFETAEKGVEAAERGVHKAEKEIETAVTYNGLTQAGAVVTAELVGVLVATSVVNGILGPEAQNS